MRVTGILLSLAAIVCSGSVGYSQETDGQINPNSLLAIPRYEQLYKVKVWREMDLREKQNKGFFAKGNEITKIILDAVKSGELTDVFETDSLTHKKKKEDFLAATLKKPQETFADWVPSKDYGITNGQGDRVRYNGQDYEAVAESNGKNPETAPDAKDYWVVTRAGKSDPFVAKDMYRIHLVEDVIFDKRRSRLYYDVLAIELSAFDEKVGGFRSVGWFKYKDLERVFRNHPDEAIWFNRQNTAENRNFADAFLLRLFHGTIYKVENPDNEELKEIYGNLPYEEVVWAMEREEMKLMEKEHNLWEY